MELKTASIFLRYEILLIVPAALNLACYEKILH